MIHLDGPNFSDLNADLDADLNAELPADLNADLPADLIGAALAGSSFADGFHHFATIGSTNTYALEQARLGATHGSFYVADEQTAGRGRSDHAWHSAACQGLYLSVLLRLPIAVREVVWLPLMAGLAAHRAIQETSGLSVDLRWPNDILVRDRKVAGILVEAQGESSGAEAGLAAVVGIGINLHQRSFPDGLATPATSLDLETGGFVSRERLLVAFLLALDEELGAFKGRVRRDQSVSEIPNRIAAVSSWVAGRRIEVHGPQPCEGVTAGLDERGFLRVQTDAGLVTVTTGGIRAVED